MLVNCPKCGFSQPQDQYCANCGVDMLAFKPVQKPLLQRILSNTIFQIVTLVAIVLTVFAIVRLQERRDLAERISAIENAPSTQVVEKRVAREKSQPIDRSQADLSSATADRAVAPESAVAAAAPKAPEAPAEQPPAAPPAPPPETTEVAQTAKTPQANDPAAVGVQKTAAPTSVRVQFYEIQRAALPNLATDPESVETLGNVTSGVVANLSQKLSTPGLGRSLESSAPKPVKTQQTVTFFSGQPHETTGEFVGYTVEVVPGPTDERGNTQMKVTVWRGMRNQNEQLQVQVDPVALPESFSVPRGGGIFIAGALPKPDTAADGEVYRQHRVFSLLSQPTFRNGVTDLVIFIEPQ